MLCIGQCAPRSKRSWSGRHASSRAYTMPQPRQLVSPARPGRGHNVALYEAFEPAEARRIAERLEIHYTPKHGSWLNMAELELGRWQGSAWTAVSPAGESWSRKPGHGKTSGIGRGFERTGASQPRTPASSSSPYTHQYKCDWVLALIARSITARRNRSSFRPAF